MKWIFLTIALLVSIDVNAFSCVTAWKKGVNKQEQTKKWIVSAYNKSDYIFVGQLVDFENIRNDGLANDYAAVVSIETSILGELQGNIKYVETCNLPRKGERVIFYMSKLTNGNGYYKLIRHAPLKGLVDEERLVLKLHRTGCLEGRTKRDVAGGKCRNGYVSHK